jgi:hypothetical protein
MPPNGDISGYNQKSSHVAAILAVLFGLLFLASSIFAIWAFSSRQDYKNNVDQKIADASAVAVQEAETAKDAEFVEKEKSPVRNYLGSPTYGSVSFDYPKTWSIYASESTGGTAIDLYAFPEVVPGIDGDTTYALRMEIISETYDSVVESYKDVIEIGDLSATAYRPAKVTSVLGLRLDGTLDENVQGSMVLLPLRDRTIKIYTQIPQFVGDFNNIILPSLTFVP